MRRFRLEHLLNSGHPKAPMLAKMLERPERFLSTVLFGNNLVNTAASALGTVLAVRLWGADRGLIIATLGMTVILLVFCETSPKVFAARYAEKLSLFYVRFIQALSAVLSPFISALSWTAMSFTNLFGGRGAGPRLLITEEEIRAMVTAGHRDGAVEKAEAEMIHKIFDFGDRPVREIMVPRPDVVGIEAGASLKDFLGIYAEKPLSRFPVYQESMDNVVGIIAVKDVLMAVAKGWLGENEPVDKIMRQAYFAPETKRINSLFKEMRDKNYRMCVVVDEYGGTAGIVSLTQLVEEIVGPVGDELHAAEKDYEVLSDNTFQIDAGMRIEDANKEMGLSLPESDEYDTVAGFILFLLGRLPRRNEQISYKGLKLAVTEIHGSKLERILLTREPRPAAITTDESQVTH